MTVMALLGPIIRVGTATAAVFWVLAREDEHMTCGNFLRNNRRTSL